MDKLKKLPKLVAALAVSTACMGANAASYTLNGEITSCSGVCTIFTAVGQSAEFTFDGTDGPGSIATGDISNVGISLSTPSGGALAFVNGFALSSSLTVDSSNLLSGGAVTLQGTGSTTGIVAQSAIDLDTGTWTAFVVSSTDNSLEQIASGSITGGTVSAVPVPAAAWLFGSALVGLAGVGRRRKIA